MIRVGLSLSLAAALLSLQAAMLPISVRAGDLNAPDAHTLRINADDFRVPNSAAATQSTQDDASRLSDLESPLARRNGPPAVSLSVSGWVGEQVIHTVNH
jgi:hypothetical protein